MYSLTYDGQNAVTQILGFVTLALVVFCIILASLSGAKYDKECTSGDQNSCKTKDSLNDATAALGVLAGASLFATFIFGGSNYADRGRLSRAFFQPTNPDSIVIQSIARILGVLVLVSFLSLSAAVALKSNCARGEINSCKNRNNLFTASTVFGGIVGAVYLGGAFIN